MIGLGVLGYLVLASDNLGEAMHAYQRYERLFYIVALAYLFLSAHGAAAERVVTAGASFLYDGAPVEVAGDNLASK